MNRTTVSSVLALCLFAGSCQPFEQEVVANTTALPHVSLEASAADASDPTLHSIGISEPARSPAQALTEAQVIEAYLTGRHTGLSRSEIRELADVVIEEADRHGIDTGLILAVMHVESSCYHRAVSPVGALGLMQIMPATGEELASQHGIPWHGPATLFDPAINVKLGVAYLKELSDRYQQLPTALAAYNWGPGHIDRRLRRGSSPPEVYVNSVMRAYASVGDDLAIQRGTSS